MKRKLIGLPTDVLPARRIVSTSAALFGGVLLAGAILVPAQQPPAQQPKIAVETRTVSVLATVRDKHGKSCPI